MEHLAQDNSPHLVVTQPEARLTTDLQGRVLSADDRFRELTGLSLQQLNEGGGLPQFFQQKTLVKGLFQFGLDRPLQLQAVAFAQNRYHLQIEPLESGRSTTAYLLRFRRSSETPTKSFSAPSNTLAKVPAESEDYLHFLRLVLRQFLPEKAFLAPLFSDPEKLLLVLDGQGRLWQVSGPLGQLLGYAENQLIGKVVTGRTHPKDLRRLLKGPINLPGASHYAPLRVLTASAEWQWLSPELVWRFRTGLGRRYFVVLNTRSIHQSLPEHTLEYRNQSYAFAGLVNRDLEVVEAGPALEQATGLPARRLSGTALSGKWQAPDQADPNAPCTGEITLLDARFCYRKHQVLLMGANHRHFAFYHLYFNKNTLAGSSNLLEHEKSNAITSLYCYGALMREQLAQHLKSQPQSPFQSLDEQGILANHPIVYERYLLLQRLPDQLKETPTAAVLEVEALHQSLQKYLGRVSEYPPSLPNPSQCPSCPESLLAERQILTLAASLFLFLEQLKGAETEAIELSADQGRLQLCFRFRWEEKKPFDLECLAERYAYGFGFRELLRQWGLGYQLQAPSPGNIRLLIEL